MKVILYFVTLILPFTLIGQTAQTYINAKGDKHLCGPIALSDLTSDTTYSQWFQESYDRFTMPSEKYKWAKKLKETQVDIYMGTWCGDTKNHVPKFVHLWKELGLEESQLNFITLYDGKERYKQGPNDEEKGKSIHRVPTFIFKDNDQEFARIVESPQNDLLTDVAQIALGYPSEPRYRAATYLLDILTEISPEEVYKDVNKYAQEAYRLTSKRKELNTLGYVFLRAGETDKALLTFHFNSYFFPNDPIVHDSYGEALSIAGKNDEAIQSYEKALELNPEMESAKEALTKLKVEQMDN